MQLYNKGVLVNIRAFTLSQCFIVDDWHDTAHGLLQSLQVYIDGHAARGLS